MEEQHHSAEQLYKATGFGVRWLTKYRRWIPILHCDAVHLSIPHADLNPSRPRVMLALATAGCLWGTGYLFGKVALGEMPVPTMVLFRFVFACAGLLLSSSLSVPT
jgi:hypothetical protein